MCGSCCVCTGCAAGSCAGSVSCLAQCRQCGECFPHIRGFRASFGDFLLVFVIFSRLRLYSLAALVVLPFSSVCLSYAWAFTCGGWPCSFSMRPSSLVVPAYFCGSFLMRRSCVFLLSSCSAQGRCLLCLLLVFAFVPLPAAPAVFCGVSCLRLPLWGSAPFLAPVACPAPAVELCLWGLRCQPYCCAGGVGWAAALPLWSQCFSHTDWLADVRWVLHPVTRCSHGGCVCSLYDSVVVPCGSLSL